MNKRMDAAADDERRHRADHKGFGFKKVFHDRYSVCPVEQAGIMTAGDGVLFYGR